MFGRWRVMNGAGLRATAQSQGPVFAPAHGMTAMGRWRLPLRSAFQCLAAVKALSNRIGA